MLPFLASFEFRKTPKNRETTKCKTINKIGKYESNNKRPAKTIR